MFLPGDFEERKTQLTEYYRSPEYQRLCQRFQTDRIRLTSAAERLMPHLTELETYSSAHTVRKEFASGSNLHRGYYCPSPVFDLIVGNTHRGRVLKRITKQSKPTHAYSFHADGTLLKCDFYCSGSISMTEYLVREDNSVFGITVDKESHLHVVTEEFYGNGRIQNYLCGLFIPAGDSQQCFEVTCENYRYDTYGLCGCSLYNALQPAGLSPAFPEGPFAELMQYPICRHSEYLFQRKDGYLSSYTSGGQQYPIATSRKA